jgi:hypothetical protein
VTGPEDAFGKQLITVATQIIRFESIQLLLVGDTTTLEEYMVLNMKMGNGKVGRIDN